MSWLHSCHDESISASLRDLSGRIPTCDQTFWGLTKSRFDEVQEGMNSQDNAVSNRKKPCICIALLFSRVQHFPAIMDRQGTKSCSFQEINWSTASSWLGLRCFWRQGCLGNWKLHVQPQAGYATLPLQRAWWTPKLYSTFNPQGKQVHSLDSSERQGNQILEMLRDRIVIIHQLRSWILLLRQQEAVQRGIALAKDGNFDEALEYYKKALEKCPTNIDALVAAGAAHANQQDFRSALRYFEDALGNALTSFIIHP